MNHTLKNSRTGATIAYDETRKDIDKQIALLKKQLKQFDAQQKKAPMAWGVVADVRRIAMELDDITSGNYAI